MAALFSGKPPDREETVRRVRESPAGHQAMNPEIDWITPDDLERATAVDRFDFVMQVEKEGNLLVTRKILL